MSHLFSGTAKVSGIYKITDTVTEQSYIGQSVDIRERFRQHIKAGLSSATATNKLYSAMKKNGLINFTFEILERVPKDKLNEREVYYIELYQTKEHGMNKTLGGS
jgi:group I intron endonuclease